MTRSTLATAGLALLAGGAAAELPRRVARPAPVCELPPFPYRPAREMVPPTVTAVSFVRVSAGGPDGPAVFQFPQPRLRVDHCYLSRLAVVLSPDGGYTVGFRADQNPQPADDPRAEPLAPLGLTDPLSPLQPGERPGVSRQTAQLTRSRFVVRVRAVGTAPLREPLPGLGATKPVLAELPVPEFWVERGQPFSGFHRGVSRDVRDQFGRIDRVEVEFTYR